VLIGLQLHNILVILSNQRVQKGATEQLCIRKSPESHRFLCFLTALLLLFFAIKTPVLNENRRSFTD
jgi:hypothetical protein